VLRLHRHGGERWVVKDFRPQSSPCANTIGRLLIRREIRALRRLAGVAGVPAGAFRLDAHALAYIFIPGVPLRPRDLGQRAADFFTRLERLLGEVHAVAASCTSSAQRTQRAGNGGGQAGAARLPVLSWHAPDAGALAALGRAPGPRGRLQALGTEKARNPWAKRAEVCLARANWWRRLWPLRGYLGVRGSDSRR